MKPIRTSRPFVASIARRGNKDHIDIEF